MNRTPLRRAALLITLASLTVSFSALAKDPPAMIFVKSKCALCHGKDGRGETPAGRQSGARDFQDPEVKSRTGAELAKTIAEGKGKMPAFKVRLSTDEIEMLVRYVRELGRND